MESPQLPIKCATLTNIVVEREAENLEEAINILWQLFDVVPHLIPFHEFGNLILDIKILKILSMWDSIGSDHSKLSDEITEFICKIPEEVDIQNEENTIWFDMRSHKIAQKLVCLLHDKEAKHQIIAKLELKTCNCFIDDLQRRVHDYVEKVNKKLGIPILEMFSRLHISKNKCHPSYSGTVQPGNDCGNDEKNTCTTIDSETSHGGDQSCCKCSDKPFDDHSSSGDDTSMCIPDHSVCHSKPLCINDKSTNIQETNNNEITLSCVYNSNHESISIKEEACVGFHIDHNYTKPDSKAPTMSDSPLNVERSHIQQTSDNDKMYFSSLDSVNASVYGAIPSVSNSCLPSTGNVPDSNNLINTTIPLTAQYQQNDRVEVQPGKNNLSSSCNIPNKSNSSSGECRNCKSGKNRWSSTGECSEGSKLSMDSLQEDKSQSLSGVPKPSGVAPVILFQSESASLASQMEKSSSNLLMVMTESSEESHQKSLESARGCPKDTENYKAEGDVVAEASCASLTDDMHVISSCVVEMIESISEKNLPITPENLTTLPPLNLISENKTLKCRDLESDSLPTGSSQNVDCSPSESTEGENADGEYAEGGDPEGRNADGENADGGNANGEDVDGEDADGEDADGEDADGELEDVDGEYAEGRNADGENADAGNANGEDVDGEDADGEDADGEDADGEDVDGEDADGENADGKDAEGEDADGEDAEGENADGEDAEGENADGEDPDGEDADGENADGENAEGENADGEDADGEDADGENADGENADGEYAEGGNADGENAEGENADGEDADGEDADGENADGENADGENADGGNADGEDADGEDADVEDADGKDADGEDADGEDADGGDAEDENAKGEENKSQSLSGVPKPCTTSGVAPVILFQSESASVVSQMEKSSSNLVMVMTETSEESHQKSLESARGCPKDTENYKAEGDVVVEASCASLTDDMHVISSCVVEMIESISEKNLPITPENLTTVPLPPLNLISENKTLKCRDLESDSLPTGSSQNVDCSPSKSTEGENADDGDAEDENADGEYAEGGNADGGNADGANADGENAGGENADGGNADGEDADGEDVDGEDVDGEDADGEDADGKDADGEDADGEDAEGEDSEGEDAEGENADGEYAEGEDAKGEENKSQSLSGVPKPCTTSGVAPVILFKSESASVACQMEKSSSNLLMVMTETLEESHQKSLESAHGSPKDTENYKAQGDVVVQASCASLTDDMHVISSCLVEMIESISAKNLPITPENLTTVPLPPLNLISENKTLKCRNLESDSLPTGSSQNVDCSPSESTEGENADGGDAEGGDADGEYAEGEDANGENADGGDADVEDADGEDADGGDAEDENAQGGNAEGENADGEDVEGEDARGENADGEEAEGEDVEGEDAEGENADGEDAEDEDAKGEENKSQSLSGVPKPCTTSGVAPVILFQSESASVVSQMEKSSSNLVMVMTETSEESLQKSLESARGCPKDTENYKAEVNVVVEASCASLTDDMHVISSCLVEMIESISEKNLPITLENLTTVPLPPLNLISENKTLKCRDLESDSLPTGSSQNVDCSPSESTEGENADGGDAEDENADGEYAEGGNADGENADGGNADGENADGEDGDGENADGEDVDGEDTRGENADGEDAEGEDAEGEDAEGENADGEDAEGEDAEGENAEGENAEGEYADGEYAYGGNADGENANGENADGGNADGENAFPTTLENLSTVSLPPLHLISENKTLKARDPSSIPGNSNFRDNVSQTSFSDSLSQESGLSLTGTSQYLDSSSTETGEGETNDIGYTLPHQGGNLQSVVSPQNITGTPRNDVDVSPRSPNEALRCSDASTKQLPNPEDVVEVARPDGNGRSRPLRRIRVVVSSQSDEECKLLPPRKRAKMSCSECNEPYFAEDSSDDKKLVKKSVFLKVDYSANGNCSDSKNNNDKGKQSNTIKAEDKKLSKDFLDTDKPKQVQVLHQEIKGFANNETSPSEVHFNRGVSRSRTNNSEQYVRKLRKRGSFGKIDGDHNTCVNMSYNQSNTINAKSKEFSADFLITDKPKLVQTMYRGTKRFAVDETSISETSTSEEDRGNGRISNRKKKIHLEKKPNPTKCDSSLMKIQLLEAVVKLEKLEDVVTSM